MIGPLCAIEVALPRRTGRIWVPTSWCRHFSLSSGNAADGVYDWHNRYTPAAPRFDYDQSSMLECSCWSTFSNLASSFRRASVSAVTPSARSLVVGFSVDLAASRNLLPAVAAQGAASLMDSDRIGGHRQPRFHGSITCQPEARQPLPPRSTGSGLCLRKLSGNRLFVCSAWSWQCGVRGVNQAVAGERLRERLSVQVGEDLASGFEFGLEGGDPGGLLGACLRDYVVDRGGEILVKFLGRAGDCGGRDREVAGQVGGALLELGAPFAVGGAGDSESQLESLGLLAWRLFGRSLPRLLSPAEASEPGASGAGALPVEVLSAGGEAEASGVSEWVGNAPAARVSTVIVTANSFWTSPAVSGLAVEIIRTYVRLSA